MFKCKKFELSPFALIWLGGIGYHLLSEAKSQYSIIFLPFVFCLASYGLVCSIEAFNLFVKKRWRYAIHKKGK